MLKSLEFIHAVYQEEVVEKAKEISDLSIIVPGSSKFPGQTGKNDNNFHIEDFQGSITHVLTGLLKMHIENKQEKN